MNYVRTTPASKGQFKCFHCRATIRSKDGAWHVQENQQVFLCKTCERVPATLASPTVANHKLF